MNMVGIGPFAAEDGLAAPRRSRSASKPATSQRTPNDISHLLELRLPENPCPRAFALLHVLPAAQPTVRLLMRRAPSRPGTLGSGQPSWKKIPMFLIYCVLKGALEVDPEAQKWTQKPRNGPRNGPRGLETDPEMDPETQKWTQKPRNGSKGLETDPEIKNTGI